MDGAIEDSSLTKSLAIIGHHLSRSRVQFTVPALVNRFRQATSNRTLINVVAGDQVSVR